MSMPKQVGPSTRRRFLRDACGCTLGLRGLGAASLPLITTPMAARAATAPRAPSMSPDEALDRLRRGNEDYVADRAVVSPQGMDHRQALSHQQSPLAVIIGCSDSRVVPELLFDSGVGELFVVRNAGNTIVPAALGSVEYGALVLGAPLIVVLGHERCGAVDAALSVVQQGVELPGHVGDTVAPILPAARAALTTGQPTKEALLDEAIRQNVLRVVGELRDDRLAISALQKEGRLKVVGARYDLDDGRVSFSPG